MKVDKFEMKFLNMVSNLEYMQDMIWESSYLHPHLYQEHHPFFSIDKGGLISESLSVWMFSQNNMPNHYPELLFFSLKSYG